MNDTINNADNIESSFGQSRNFTDTFKNTTTTIPAGAPIRTESVQLEHPTTVVLDVSGLNASKAPQVEEDNSPTNLNWRLVFSLMYLHKGTAMIANFVEESGELYKAIARGKLYCERMRFRFLQVRPFVTDLAKEERKMEF